MNKLMGFFELKDSGLPTIPWEIYNDNVMLDANKLWTIRTAVDKGEDLNLPRKVGVDSKSAKAFAEEMNCKLKNKGMVIYYPYFIAEKSGVMEITPTKTVIEAVRGDLWNYVNHHNLDLTLIYKNDELQNANGDEKFLYEEERDKLLVNASKARYKFRALISEDKSIFLEWSFAYTSDINKNAIGNKELVFYEARSV